MYSKCTVVYSAWKTYGWKQTAYLCCGGIFLLLLFLFSLGSLVPHNADDPDNYIRRSGDENTWVISSLPNFSSNLSENFDYWRTVEEGKVFTYSAFLDTRPWSYDANVYVIRIWSILEVSRNPTEFYCQLWIGGNKSMVLRADGYRLPEQVNRRYRYFATEFVCPVSKSLIDDQDPGSMFVTVVYGRQKNTGRPIAAMPLHQMAKVRSTSRQYHFTVCLGGPLKNGISDVNHLAEWVEMNNIFGADHFILYNHSAGNTLDKVLAHYEKSRKLIEVMSWQIPKTLNITAKNIKNFGQIALINDCLHRSMYTSEYVVFLDLDEYIVPRHHGISNWRDLLKSMKCKSSQYIFRHISFKLQWENDTVASRDTEVVMHNLLTQLKTRREKAVWPRLDWSKYMVQPQQVLLPGLRLAHQMLNMTEPCNVDPDDALLHHYRQWPLRGAGLEDKIMHSYRDELVKRVKSVLQKL